MEGAVATLDFLYLALIVVLLLVEHFVLWPTFQGEGATVPA